jgi:flagellar export protein FliJ
MRGFVFKLEPALELRKRQERDRMLVVARLERQRLAIQDRVDAINGQVQATQQDARRLARTEEGVVDVHGVRMAATTAMFARVNLQRCAIELAGLERQIQAARKLLLDATIARKGVELLRERQYRAYLALQARRETNELDDLSISRFVRQSADEASEAAAVNAAQGA